MASEDSTTWGEVCKNVGFGENLYRSCREKVPSYNGGLSTYDQVPDEPTADFGKQLAASALSIPEPPPADWKAPPEDTFLGPFNMQQILLYGGLAAAVYWFFMRQRAEGASGAVETAAAPKAVTTPKAA